MNVYDNLAIVRLAILGLSDFFAFVVFVALVSFVQIFGRLQRWAGAPTLQARVESGTVGQGWPC